MAEIMFKTAANVPSREGMCVADQHTYGDQNRIRIET